MPAHEWLVLIDEEYKILEKEYLALEPEKRLITKAQMETLEQIRLSWLTS